MSRFLDSNHKESQEIQILIYKGRCGDEDIFTLDPFESNVKDAKEQDVCLCIDDSALHWDYSKSSPNIRQDELDARIRWLFVLIDRKTGELTNLSETNHNHVRCRLLNRRSDVYRLNYQKRQLEPAI
jgi:hypothetical protein